MLSEIGRKLVLTKSWRWFPGMLTLGGDRVKRVTDDGRVFLDRGFVTLDAANNWSVEYPALDWGDFPKRGRPRDPRGDVRSSSQGLWARPILNF